MDEYEGSGPAESRARGGRLFNVAIVGIAVLSVDVEIRKFDAV